MRDRLILLPGWGLGISPLEPLAAALQGLDEHLRVHIEPLPVLASGDLDEWLDELDASLPDNAWLGGWSLGGMLASELAIRVLSLMTAGRAQCPAKPSMRFSPGAMPIPRSRSSASACCVPRARKTLAGWRACWSVGRRIRLLRS